MTGRLAETMVVGEEDLRALAQARAQQVRDYFITIGKIDPERLFLAKGEADPAKAGKGPRVFLNLQ
jgi:outer membrane protein OmpA-like peptidoglycan-associated protein